MDHEGPIAQAEIAKDREHPNEQDGFDEERNCK
jgi:hypothetical protein